MDTFTYTPHVTTSAQMTPRVLRARFGDGYMQETGDGVSPMLRVWDLVFQNIPATGTPSPALTDINTFLTTQAGYKKFLWVQPTPFNVEGAMMFVCPQWQYDYVGAQLMTLRAHFEQRPS
jgi:phage-related protein